MIHFLKNFNKYSLLEYKFKYEQDDECQHILLMSLTLIVGIQFKSFGIEFPLLKKYNGK